MIWGNHNACSLIKLLDSVYAEVVHWRLAFMKILAELSRLFKAFAEGSSFESVALKAAFVLPALLLQRPSKETKDKMNCTILERRLKEWKDGDFYELLVEGRSIQSHRFNQQSKRRSGSTMSLSSSFAHLLFQGKVDAALQLLSSQHHSGKVLSLNEVVDDSGGLSMKDILKEKHPEQQSVCSRSLLHHDNIISAHPVVFEALDGKIIRRLALNVKGGAGPSGLNAYSWRRLCTSFGEKSDGLCHSLALMAKRLCTEYVDPDLLSPFLACRLIALDKNPGVDP